MTTCQSRNFLAVGLIQSHLSSDGNVFQGSVSQATKFAGTTCPNRWNRMVIFAHQNANNHAECLQHQSSTSNKTFNLTSTISHCHFTDLREISKVPFERQFRTLSLRLCVVTQVTILYFDEINSLAVFFVLFPTTQELQINIIYVVLFLSYDQISHQGALTQRKRYRGHV